MPGAGAKSEQGDLSLRTPKEAHQYCLPDRISHVTAVTHELALVARQSQLETLSRCLGGRFRAHLRERRERLAPERARGRRMAAQPPRLPDLAQQLGSEEDVLGRVGELACLLEGGDRRLVIVALPLELRPELQRLGVTQLV